MEISAAKIILANLRDRIETGSDGKHRLSGILTQTELDALNLVIDSRSDVLATSAGINVEPAVPLHSPAISALVTKNAGEPIVAVDLSTLALPAVQSSYRVCLDFGTAMSKASLVHDDDLTEDIRVLKLGIPGDQEQVDENMLVSSVFIDTEGLIWFGQKAVEQSQNVVEGSHARMDNIKRALSEGNLAEPLDVKFNPTQHSLIYEDMVLAYLAFFTWTINEALAVEVDGITPNFFRRFAMPCFPRANARIVESKLKVLLGEAQVLADTFGAEIHDGLPLTKLLSAQRQLRSEKRAYDFVGESVTEPLGVAGSLLSWRNSHDSLALVVDIGAGTSDFSLYRLHVTEDEDGSFRSVAGEVDGTARGITEAGNHLDKILMAFILSRSNVDSSHPKYINITHALERDIRQHKEALFNSGSAYVVLYTNDVVEISLEDFLRLDAVLAFEEQLRTTLVKIMEDADPAWIEWIRSNASRYLTIVLTGGGASLPMAKKLAQGTVTAHGATIQVAPALSFPSWLRDDYPDLEEAYPRMAVSLGGARKNVIKPMQRPLTTTGSGMGGHALERFATRGV
jgi:molecular chaperone HscA